MDFNCNAYRPERTHLDVRFVGLDYGFARSCLQKTCGFADLLYEDFAAGADRLEVHDQPSTPPYRQKGRDRLMTPI